MRIKRIKTKYIQAYDTFADFHNNNNKNKI